MSIHWKQIYVCTYENTLHWTLAHWTHILHQVYSRKLKTIYKAYAFLVGQIEKKKFFNADIMILKLNFFTYVCFKSISNMSPPPH